MTYALLIYRTLAPSLPASNADGLAGHRALQAEASAAHELHAVAQLAPPVTARAVRAHGNAHEVTDGPFVESKEWLVGFYLIDCESEEQALARAKQICPHEDHAVEVRPVAWRWRP
ncbi:MAG TPA: YciI family protein [Polyangiales bacterium]